MRHARLPNGYLKLTAEPGDFAEGEDTPTIYELLEHLLANSDLQWIDSVDTGDLTGAPMLGVLGQDEIGTERPGYRAVGFWDDSPRVAPILERWAWMDYAVTDLVDEIREKGFAVLQGGPFVELDLTSVRSVLQDYVRIHDAEWSMRSDPRLDSARAVLRKDERHFIVSGRIPGDDEDTVSHVVVPLDVDPWHKFVETLYEDADEALPADWSTQDRITESGCVEWAILCAIIEINGAPLNININV